MHLMLWFPYIQTKISVQNPKWADYVRQRVHCASLHIIVNSLTCASTLQNKAQNSTWERHWFVFCYEPHGSGALLNSFQLALSCTCTISVNHLYFLPKIFPNLFEASLYLSSLSGRLVCSVHTQLCIPALKATSLQMPVLAGDYLSNTLWLVHAPQAKSLRWNEVG